MSINSGSRQCVFQEHFGSRNQATRNSRTTQSAIRPRTMFTGRQHQMTNKLYVTNISTDATETDLRDLFEQVGAVVSVRIAIHPKTGLQRNYGFVEMETPELAQAAEKSLNNHL